MFQSTFPVLGRGGCVLRDKTVNTFQIRWKAVAQKSLDLDKLFVFQKKVLESHTLLGIDKKVKKQGGSWCNLIMMTS